MDKGVQFYQREKPLKDANRITNSEALDQSSGSGLFNETYLSENLASIHYFTFFVMLTRAISRMVLVVNFSLFFCVFFGFVVAIFDLLHDVETMHGLC